MGKSDLEVKGRLGIEMIPPLALALQMLGEPRLDRLHPKGLTVGLEDVVVFARDFYQFDRPAKDLQGIVERCALAGRDVDVGRAVQEQERGVDLVGVEERTVLGVELGIVPREASCRSHGAVAQAPITPGPIAGDRTDACVANRSCEEIRAGLQILRHEASVASPSATDLLGIDEGMGGDEGLHRSDDIVRSLRPPSIQVVAGEGLPVADGATRVERIGYIALCGEHR